jgi:polyisoprenoid-binding protein YceI
VTVTAVPHGISTGTWEIDRAHSTVGFVARHLMISKVRGRFTDFSGTIRIAADPTQSSATATIQAASIDTAQPDRDAHLRSADFLEAETFPTIEFASTAVRGAGEGYEIDGDLTIRGVTQPVTLRLEVLGAGPDAWGGTRAAFEARTEISRKAFGLEWNATLETGGVVVGDKVQIELDIQAVLQA